MPDQLQSLTEIAERCREMQRKCNPSKLPVLASDVAELAEQFQHFIKIIQQVVVDVADANRRMDTEFKRAMDQAIASRETPEQPGKTEAERIMTMNGTDSL